MENRLYSSVVIELRPKLRSANVFIVLKEDCPETTSISLSENNFSVSLSGNKQFSTCLQDFKAEASTLSSLKISKKYISFRFFTSHSNSGSFKTELIENTSSSDKSERFNDIQPNISYTIACVNCQRNLCSSTLTFRRVLPLPETLDQGEWFCHAHASNQIQANDLEPTANDFFYTACYMHLSKNSIKNFLSKNEVVACKFCLNWLGIHSQSSTLRLWFNTVTITDTGGTVIQTKGLSDVFVTIANLFRNSLFNSLRTVFRYRKSNGASNFLLLWVLEKQLKISFSDKDALDKEVEVAKALFKFLESEKHEVLEQWLNDQTVELVDVSKNMMLEVLKHLYKCHELFPAEFAKSNGFLVSYLFMYE
ncbi:uncharacterized protein [Euwallacea similis]|uniref:uncharacterized protein n=1 Tax=Euwallacea similis TaxID=1736056 RepID=UPI00344B3D83